MSYNSLEVFLRFAAFVDHEMLISIPWCLLLLFIVIYIGLFSAACTSTTDEIELQIIVILF